VWPLIKHYAESAGVPGIAPHDVRRRAGINARRSFIQRAVDLSPP